MIVDKPAGWLSVPSRDSKDSRPIVGLKLQEEVGQRLFPVHRLDFEVSGILVFAKDAKTHTLWQDVFQERSVKKIYHAVTFLPDPGILPPTFRAIYQEPDLTKESTWECLLEKGKRRAFEAPHGKSSITKAKVLTHLKEGRLLWELIPVTGRSHQLRYEMYRHGCPILGDHLYGSQIEMKNEILLRHVQLTLDKPLSGFKSLNVPTFSQ